LLRSILLSGNRMSVMFCGMLSMEVPERAASRCGRNEEHISPLPSFYRPSLRAFHYPMLRPVDWSFPVWFSRFCARDVRRIF
jgi:hypothetical protein